MTLDELISDLTELRTNMQRMGVPTNIQVVVEVDRGSHVTHEPVNAASCTRFTDGERQVVIA